MAAQPKVKAKHVRRRRHEETHPRHSKRLKKFIAAQATRLASAAVKATGVLTAASNPGDGKVVTIGSRTYTFQDTLTNVNGNVKIGASLTASLTNLKNAINGSGGTSGTDYAAATVAHTAVDATASTATTLTVAAKTAGTSGNALASTTDIASASFAAVTLQGGAASEPFDTYDYLKRNSAARIAGAASAASLD